MLISLTTPFIMSQISTTIEPKDDHINFVLPGRLIDPNTHAKSMLACAFLYSRHWNPQNLKYHWYGPWSCIFHDLTQDILCLLPIPQYPLYFISSYNDPAARQPGEAVDQGNTTLDSITSTHISPDSSVIPDFVITRIVYCMRDDLVINDELVGWRAIKIFYAGIPLICKIKRGAKRFFDVDKWLSSSGPLMTATHKDVERQAAHLFLMYLHQQSVILVAASGIWWSYCIVNRQDILLKEEDSGSLAQVGEVGGDNKPDLEDIPEDNNVHGNIPAVMESGTNFDTDVPLDYHSLDDTNKSDGKEIHVKGPALEKVLPPDQLQLQEGHWSGFLCIDGTA
ncbi:hypothetical protein SERLA73DRAFT_150335 [Serpula lacrymans var. lacrymans S7.3]|uniref:Uncharacterized protein n=2 Tax=Serpula lacrymans var. lacrymans TaxID=341189 RepID=F8PM54_SERL3|nr:uncharacterized protein SERLADRAFT_405945 [Serpula lacrymans var. lacrymans S7.9]EGO02686.1 hypothetical protein SERLA73DRAFT_150335 [Serpula lacrymans var. lacrymans S7.3]EGO28385.1 hypothetical protein SERLADRAFT_405945 [Serpula lacrymans var. lacrymans S7.9]